MTGTIRPLIRVRRKADVNVLLEKQVLTVIRQGRIGFWDIPAVQRRPL